MKKPNVCQGNQSPISNAKKGIESTTGELRTAHCIRGRDKRDEAGGGECYASECCYWY